MIRQPERTGQASALRAARCTPEVEPLGDVRWARIEQSLMQRLDSELPAAEPTPARASARAPAGSNAPVSNARPRTWPVALAATFAAAAAAAFALHLTRPSVHASTSRVVTEASPSHVTIAENSLDVSPESGIVVSEEEHATVLTLERGEVSLHVAPREKDRPFLVEAGDVQVRVVGTEFTVRRVGVGATVTVRHGVVQVREHGELALVRAGERWPDETKEMAPAVPPRAAESVGAAQPQGAVLVEPQAQGAALSQEQVAASAQPQRPVAPVGRQPHRASAPLAQPHSPAPPPRKQGGGNVGPSDSAVEASPAALPEAPGPGVAPEPTSVSAPAPVSAAPPSAQSQYEAAAQIERSDPARALRIYTQLARGSDPWAQNALYAAGRLQADRGARTDAARLLEEYLRRFPRGSNAQDARALRESLR
jgi:ferric-dicitrate binding protein FerR (iron transport regulator)